MQPLGTCSKKMVRAFDEESVMQGCFSSCIGLHQHTRGLGDFGSK